MSNELNEAELKQYETDGFLVLRYHFDTTTIKKLAKASEALLETVKPHDPKNPRIQVDIIADQPRVRQIYPLIDLSDCFESLSRDPRVIDPIRSIFGGGKLALFEDKINYKFPGGASGFPMHQDYVYWNGYSKNLITALIYLDEADERNGCMQVVPQHHRQGELTHERQRLGLQMPWVISPDTLDPALTIKAPGPAGTMLLFSCMTPHMSNPNCSNTFRRAIILTYNPEVDGQAYENESGQIRDQAIQWMGSR